MSRAPIKLKRKPPEWKPFDADEEKINRPAKKPRICDSKYASDFTKKIANMYGCGEVQKVLEEVTFFPAEISDMICRYDCSTTNPVIASSVPLSRTAMPEFKKWTDGNDEYYVNWIDCIAKRAAVSYEETAMHKGLRGFSSIRVIRSQHDELCEIEFHIGFTLDAAIQHLPIQARRTWVNSQTSNTLAVIVVDHETELLFYFFIPFRVLYDKFVNYSGST
jgi:hypothetical protein